MESGFSEPVVVLRSRDRREGADARLVLVSMQIPAELVFQDGWWLLLVPAEAAEAAVHELAAYRAENQRRPASRPPPVPVLGGGVAGMFVYVFVMLAVAMLANRWAFGLDWKSAGVMRAGPLLEGEWWRAITALTLHADAGHLTANLVFGVVFGLLAASALGGGVAWSGILLAGALGNTLNAFVQAPTHASIGASTAVFAALGIIVAHALRYWSALGGGWLRRWSPMVGGVLLLAYTGTGGERTDIVAHLTGFIAGLLLGWVGSRMPVRYLDRPGVQAAAAAVGCALLIGSWIVALVTAG